MSNPLVSICIPAYNAESTLARCLRGILAQDLSDAEIILIDNCSEDRTLQVAEECLSGVPRVRIIRNGRNLGRVGNWNRCLQQARGAYIKFSLTNDMLLPGGLAGLLRMAQQYEQAVMICSKPKYVTEMPDPLPKMQEDFSSVRRSDGETLEFFARQGFQTGSLNGMLYKRAPIVEDGIEFREDLPYFSDYFFAIQLAEHGSAVFIDAETYCFDASVQTRFHFVGLQDPRSFFLQHRRCALKLQELLGRKGRDRRSAFDYLNGQYIWYLGQGARLSTLDAIRIFAGRPTLQWSTATKTLCYRLRQKAGCKFS